GLLRSRRSSSEKPFLKAMLRNTNHGGSSMGAVPGMFAPEKIIHQRTSFGFTQAVARPYRRAACFTGNSFKQCLVKAQVERGRGPLGAFGLKTAFDQVLQPTAERIGSPHAGHSSERKRFFSKKFHFNTRSDQPVEPFFDSREIFSPDFRRCREEKRLLRGLFV